MKRLIVVTFLSTFISSTAMADEWANYQVTITNATNHHVLTPPLLVTHDKQFQLFSVGGAASDGLVIQAETGDPSVLYGEVNGAYGVQNAVTGSTVIPYGQSASFEISANKKSMLSVSSMLATTNDAFAGLHAVGLPKKTAQYFAYAYDAGSEMNNESCTHIPGPPCLPDSGNARTETSEGFIAIHNGIHGGSDLNPKHLDWRGPVAVITVTRIDD